MDYKGAIIADGFVAALVGLASRDGLLAPGFDPMLERHFRRARAAQDALPLLVLFDRLILLNWTGSELRIPKLEQQGIVEVRPVDLPLATDFSSSDWYENRDPQAFRRCLARVFSSLPLVLPRIATYSQPELVTFLTRQLRVSRLSVLTALLDYADAYYSEDSERLKTTPLRAALGTRATAVFDRALRRKRLTSRSAGRVDAVDEILFSAFVAADTLAVIQEQSSREGLPVATRDFAVSLRLTSQHPAMIDAERLAKGFRLARSVLHSEGPEFPRIESVEDALRLRNDPNMTAFRRELTTLMAHLAAGDASAVARLGEDVAKARRALARKFKLERLLRWATYSSLPVSVIETLLGVLPVGGMTISIAAASGTAVVERTHKRHSWVLFGKR